MNFFTGIKVYGDAVEILFSKKFWWFLIFPVFVLLLLLIGGNILTSYAGDSLYHLIQEKLESWMSGISWLQWVTVTTNVLIRIVLKILYFFFFVAFGGYIILILMSPVYSWLSERTEAHLTGKEYPFSFRQFCWEIFRGIMIAFRNMFFQLLVSLILFLFSFIPVIGFLSPVAIFFSSAYFYGFAFMDYAIERKRFNVKQSVRYINKNMGLVTGVGTVFAFCLMIPWFSLIACSFVSLLSVIAGTLAVNRVELQRGKRM